MRATTVTAIRSEHPCPWPTQGVTAFGSQPRAGIPMEQWLPLVDFEDRYEISNLGRIRSIRHQGIFRLKIRKLSNDGDGYAKITLKKDGLSKTLKVSRLILTVFIGPPLGKECAAHINGDSSDNRLCNLRWATHKENENDKLRHGTWHNGRRGEKELAKTHCPRNHPYDEENTYRNGNRRQCRQCTTERHKRKRLGLV